MGSGPSVADHTGTPGERRGVPGAATTRWAWVASTGRTATMFLATCLNRLDDVVGLHEGHLPGEPPQPRLPLINVHNRRAWHEPGYPDRLVAEKRSPEILAAAAGQAGLAVDAAFYNAPLLPAIARRYPEAALMVIFRRCEGFVRSATIVRGEDRYPAGWPDRSKRLTDREQFISLGRLKPAPDHLDRPAWDDWSAVQRNIWLWTTVNTHLLRFARANPDCQRLFFEDLVARPETFWAVALHGLGILSPATLAACVRFSRSKVNQRPSYQIGGADCWTAVEQAFFRERARLLEATLYG